METLHLKYSPFVLPEVVDEFAANFTSIKVVKEVISIDRRRGLEDFDFTVAVGFIISLVSQREFSLSVLSTLTAEALKELFTKPFKCLSLNKRKDTPSSMKVELNYKDVKGSFELNGNFTKQELEQIFLSFANIIKSEQLQKDSANSNLHKDPINLDGVRYYVDEGNNLFLPHDFQKDREELSRRIQELGH